MDREDFEQTKQKAHEIYTAQASVYNPYFKGEVFLTAKGFYHLQATNGRLRSEKEQSFKFRYLPLALQVIKTSSTIQEYRKMEITVDGEIKNADF